MVYRFDDSGDLSGVGDSYISQIGSGAGPTSTAQSSSVWQQPRFGRVDGNGNPFVYYGSTPSVLATSTGRKTPNPGSAIGTYLPGEGTVKRNNVDQLVGLDQALSQVYAWQGTKYLDQWAQLLVDEGLIQESDRSNLSVLNDWWQKAVQESLNYQAAGKKVTPQDAVKLSLAPGVSSSASIPSTRVSVNVSSASEAKSLITDSFMQRMGRAPTDAELSNLTAALQTAQRSNPTVTSYNADGTSTTTAGGLDAQQYLSDQAMQMPEYGAYQAAAFYYPLLPQAIQSPV